MYTWAWIDKDGLENRETKEKNKEISVLCERAFLPKDCALSHYN